MKTTKELIIADITAKVKAKLASQNVNLNQVDDILKEFPIGSKLKDLADSKLRQCEALAKEAQSLYKQALFELKEIQSQIENVKNQAKELGLQAPDRIGAIGGTVSTMISDIVTMDPIVKRTMSLFK